MLKKKKKKRRKDDARKLAQAERIFELYFMGETARSIAEATGVDVRKIQRLISEGSRRLRLEPFAIRRQRLMLEIIKRRDDDIIERFSKLQEVTATAAEAAVLRTLGRIQRAHVLESEDIYEDGNFAQYKAAQAIGYNPTPKDVKDLVEAMMKIGGGDQKAPVHVNVQQNQQQAQEQGQVAAVDAEGVDHVLKYLETMRANYGAEERRAIEGVMCGASLLREKEQNAISQARGLLPAEQKIIAAVNAEVDGGEE